jgi:hypothetical protein
VADDPRESTSSRRLGDLPSEQARCGLISPRLIAAAR